jgi:hypothetical protein
MKTKKITTIIIIAIMLISSLTTVWAPNDVNAVYAIYDNKMNVVNIAYTIKGPGDPDAHVNVNTRNMDGNVAVIDPDGVVLFNMNNVSVNWRANWTGPTGKYPTPNNVLMSGNLRDNNTDIPEILIPADQIKAPGKYTFIFNFTYYEIVPGKPDRVVTNYIDGNPKNYYIRSNTTLIIDPINNITEGDNATISGSLIRDYDNTTLSNRSINLNIDSNHSYNVTTDNNGRFSLNVENLTIGNYMVEGIYNQDKLNPIYLTSDIVTSSFSVKKKPPVPPIPTPVNPIGNNTHNNITPVNPIENNTHNNITPVTTSLDVTGGPLAGILLWAMVLCIVYTLNRKE